MRKKSFLVILIVILLVLITNCKSIKGITKAKSPDLNKAFTSEVVIKYDNTEVKGFITRYGTGFWEMEINKPETLAGLKIIYDSNGVKALLGELELDIPLEKLNNNAVFAILFKVIDSAASMNELEFAQIENGITYSGNTDYGTYILTFDPSNYNLTNISIPDMNIDVKVLSVIELNSGLSKPGNTNTDVSENTTGEKTEETIG